MVWLFIAGFGPGVTAQEYTSEMFSNYMVQKGLPDNDITSICQDEKGYIWIATMGGLARFDGNRFYKYNPTDEQGYPFFTRIEKIKNIGSGRLALLSYQGLFIINTNNMALTALKLPGHTPLTARRNNAWDAQLLPDNSIALSSVAGFYVFDKNAKLKFSYDAYKEEDISDKRIFYGKDLFSISDNELLLYHSGTEGASIYDYKANRLRNLLATNKKEAFFIPPVYDGIKKWKSVSRISANEFIFTYDKHDSILYVDMQRGIKALSVLPFKTEINLGWESHVTAIDDSTFIINGGSDGFFTMKLNRANGKVQVSDKKMLQGHKINCLFVDKDKRIWGGTLNGILKQNLHIPPFKKYNLSPPHADTSELGYVSALRYKKKLYLGRYSWTMGLCIVDTADMKIKQQLQFYGPGGWNEIRAIQQYHEDTLWLSSTRGLLWLDVNTLQYGKVSDRVSGKAIPMMGAMLRPGPDGKAWLCGFLNNVLVSYHVATRRFIWYTDSSKPALPFKKIKNIVYDAYGDLWISGHALSRWNSKLGLFDTLINIYGGKEKFNDDIIAISSDNKGSLWLHNVYNGLLEYRIAEKKFVAYDAKDGLPVNVIDAMSTVVNNQLWMASNNFLVKMDIVQKKMELFDPADGLSFYKSWSRRIYYDSANALFYLTCGNELVRFANSSVLQPDFGSPLLVEQLVLNGQKTFFYPADSMQLSWKENNLSVGFDIIDYERAAGYRFSYRLNDNAAWQELGNQRNIIFTNLPTGKYNLQLKSISPSGLTRYKDFHFFIKPPFWKSMWFIMLCAIILLVLLYLLYRYRIRQIRQKANIDRQLAQTEMKALHAQMNPHFVFNSLNSIREMILNNENKEASHYLSKFAHLIRMALDNSNYTFVTLRNTVDYLERYVEMEKIRTGNFSCTISVAEELDQDEVMLPPMLIQPFIENAIWHGAPIDQKIMIRVDFLQQGSQLICHISDNGIGIESSLANKPAGHFHRSLGISNVENRIRLLNEKYDLESSISITDKKYQGENGTIVTLRLPGDINE